MNIYFTAKYQNDVGKVVNYTEVSARYFNYKGDSDFLKVLFIKSNTKIMNNITL